jgi:hypothetical protein
VPTSYTWTVVLSAEPEVAEAQAAAEAAALPRDIALDLTTGELDVSTGGLRLTRGAEAVAQSIYIALRMSLGEWFLDLDEGFPWFELVLVKAPEVELIRAALRETLLARVGVSDVASLDVSADTSTRTLDVSFAVETDYGELSGQLATTAEEVAL